MATALQKYEIVLACPRLSESLLPVVEAWQIAVFCFKHFLTATDQWYGITLTNKFVIIALFHSRHLKVIDEAMSSSTFLKYPPSFHSNRIKYALLHCELNFYCLFTIC